MMRAMRWACSIGVLATVVLGGASRAGAQATRTWVSGVGDDANPCSRTAPCKTFAGAISKTAAGGEIDALDPGGFGAVTITKSIIIDGGGMLAGVLVAGTNGIVVNAAPTDRVVLRGLDINGVGQGLNGVRFTAGASLHVERCTIANFTTLGIDVTTGGEVFVKDTILRGNVGGGIQIAPSSGTAHATSEGTHADDNLFGVTVQGHALAPRRCARLRDRCRHDQRGVPQRRGVSSAGLPGARRQGESRTLPALPDEARCDDLYRVRRPGGVASARAQVPRVSQPSRTTTASPPTSRCHSPLASRRPRTATRPGRPTSTPCSAT